LRGFPDILQRDQQIEGILSVVHETGRRESEFMNATRFRREIEDWKTSRHEMKSSLSRVSS